MHYMTVLTNELIKRTISDVSKQYENDSEVDDVLLWEVIKMEVRASSIVYAKQKKHI